MYELASSQKGPRTFRIVHKRIISLAYNEGHWRFVEKSSALFGFVMMYFAEDDSPPRSHRTAMLHTAPLCSASSASSSSASVWSDASSQSSNSSNSNLTPCCCIIHPAPHLLPSTSPSHPRGRNKKSQSNWLSNYGIPQEEPQQEPTFRAAALPCLVKAIERSNSSIGLSVRLK